MTPDRMEKVAVILERALALDVGRRIQFLDEACAGDAELRREVESLLASHQQAGSDFLNSPAVGAVESPTRAAVRQGRRIGAYDILEQIGHGGMGEVFSAVRADGQYEKKVAIKLVRSGYDTESILERFRNERQILASLDHPNIARLLDGGTTDDGIPYLVMELVDGTPVDDYCDARKLNITSRLQLFRQICGAVQYAHQHLVIHRDIKPSNILVTPEGSPKLLDFGIAKLLDASGGTEATVLRPMSPEYASPEQIRGEPITTATDVYSLGVVLYRLLTGRSPYRVDSRTPAKLAGAITGSEPERPSTSVQRIESILRDGELRELTSENVSGTREASPLRLQQRLRGDLDFILLKALRKEPARRYASVDQFAEDLRHHLEGLPVTARKGTWSYRTGKFVQRHKAGVAAATLVLVTLVAGVVVTLREARIAEANRRRAEARFNDVRKLANSLMFEVHDSIENIPGATQARKLVLQRSLEYLDSLAKESGNDPDLLRELATAYRRIGMIQGNPKDPNLGDTKGALASFQKSLELRESLARLNPKSSKDQVQLAIAYLDFSDLQSNAAGNVVAGFQYCKKGLAILDREAPANPNDVLILTQSTRGYANLGMMEVGEGAAGRIGTASGAIADLQKALVIDEQIIRLSPSDLSFKGHQALINGLLGEAMLNLGDRPQALTYYRGAIEIMNDLNAKQNNVRFASNAAILEGKVGNALLMDGKIAEAIPYFTRAQQTAVRLASLDTGNEFLKQTKINSTAELGLAYVEGGRVSEGIQHIHDALTENQSDLTQTPQARIVRGIYHTWMGQALGRQGKIREASQEYLAGKDLLAAVRAGGSDDVQTQISFCSATDHLAGSFLKLGELEKAKGEYEQSLALLEPLSRSNPDDQEVLYALAETYTGEGMISTKLAETNHAHEEQSADWKAAHDWFQKSLTTWSRVSHPARISPSGVEATPPDEVSRRLAQCDAQLASLKTSSPSNSPPPR